MRDLTRGHRDSARERFLLLVWRELVSPVEWDVALARVAQVAIPDCADCCFLQLADGNAVARLVEVAYANPEWTPFAAQLRRCQPCVARSGQQPLRKIVLLPNVDGSRLVRTAFDEGQVTLLKEIGIQSLLMVPVVVSGRPFAVLTFAYSQFSGRRYGTDDLAWALEIAARAGLAVERTVLRQQLETSNLAREELLAVLAYELESPLNAASGYIRLLQSDAVDLALRSRAAIALKRNLVRLRRVVRDLLDTSRAASGRLNLQMKPLAAADVVQDAVNAVLPTARAKDIALQCMIPPVAGSVHADRDRLYQAVWGLISNAIKFTPPGGQIRVSVEHRESQVEITVADSGVGIPSDLLPRLFELFWQEDAGFSRIHGGLGLGLALVRRIVELHGGSVRAASAGPGRGSTFTIALQRLTRSGAEETPPTTCIARMEGLRVLLVENDRRWIELVVDLLTLAGARVFVEQSAAAILSQLQTEHPHVVLLDVSLPRMAAWEFIAGIRRSESPGIRSVRAAAVSDQPSPELHQRALAAGFQMLVPRSLPAEELLDAVIRLATMRVDTTPAS